jgi:phage baseplate assembly protein W
LLQRKKSLLSNLTNIRSALQGIRDQASAAASLYHGAINGVAGYIRSCANLIEETLLIVDETNLVDAPARELWSALRDTQQVLGNAKLLSQGYRQPFTPSLVKPPTTTVQPGDTIQGVAYKALGDSSRWPELVALNGLSWPYMDFSGPGDQPDSSFTTAGKIVLGKGSVLKLPNAQGVVVPQDPIGTDFDDAGTKHVLLGGVDNLKAALLRRLRTPKGYLPHHPDYGSDLLRFVGSPMTPATVMASRAEAARTLMADPRVISVQPPSVRVQNDAIFIDTSCQTVLGVIPVSAIIR